MGPSKIHEAAQHGQCAGMRHALLALLLPVITIVFSATGLPAGTTILRGTLAATQGRGPVLKTPQASYVLAGQSPYLLRVLEDKRLLNQELEVEGSPETGGTFVVDRIYAVRRGQLYKIQYYCDVCNITYVQPGHCYCCGKETKLQEVPVSSASP